MIVPSTVVVFEWVFRRPPNVNEMLLVAEKVVVVVSECGEITCVLDLDLVLSRVSDEVFEWPNALSDFVIVTVNVTVADCV